MEETTSWKNHTFTGLIFGGIIVLCAIFFVLGMVVGRNQGRALAESAFQEQEARKSPGDNPRDNFKLNFYDETTGKEPDLSLQPAPPEPKPAPKEQKEERDAAKPKPAPERAAAPPPKPPAPPAAPELFLQVAASKNEKQANDELKKVKSKGFQAKILIGTKDNAKVYRVVVGPYKESEVSLAKKDLQAKGYKGAFLAK